MTNSKDGMDPSIRAIHDQMIADGVLGEGTELETVDECVDDEVAEAQESATPV